MSNLENFLGCELRIIEAKNLEFVTTGKLFVRCCLGNNEKIRLNSREIPPTYQPYWNECFSLECFAAKEQCLKELKQQSVAFELRWRNNSPSLVRIGGSKLLGRAVIPWKDVLESPELGIQKWVSALSDSRDIIKSFKPNSPPEMHVGMKVRIPSMADMVKRRKDVELQRWDDCNCNIYITGADELLALAGTTEALYVADEVNNHSKKERA